jgi:hypothetical protein
MDTAIAELMLVFSELRYAPEGVPFARQDSCIPPGS